MNDTSRFILKCPEVNFDPDCQVFWLVCNLAILLTLCIVGVAGNTLSFFVLRYDNSNKVATFLLQTLAVADNCFLFISALVLGLILGIFPLYPSTQKWARFWLGYHQKYVNPLAYMLQTYIAWITVLLAINRYVAICFPFHSLWLFTKRKARALVVIICSCSIIFSLPRIFQYSIHRDGYSRCVTYSRIGPGSLFDMIYINWLYVVLVLLIPFLLLIILNALVVRELRVRRQVYRARSTRTREQAAIEDNITVTMVMIAVVFLICNAPDHVRAMVTLLANETFKGNWLQEPCQYVHVTTSLLVVCNSCSNFFIYYLVRNSFRTNLIKMVTRRNNPQEETSQRKSVRTALTTI